MIIIPFRPLFLADIARSQSGTSPKLLLCISYISKPFTNKKIALNCYLLLTTGGMLTEGQNDVKFTLL